MASVIDEPKTGLDHSLFEPDWIFTDEQITLREKLIEICAKEIRPRAKGSASRILKRSSHITVVVEPKEA